MKTLQDIRDSGTIDEYMRGLMNATSSVMPSADGHPDHLCHFVVLILAPDGTVEIGSSLPDDEFTATVLGSVADQMKAGKGVHARTVKAAGPLPAHARRPPAPPKKPQPPDNPRLWRAVPDEFKPDDEGGAK